MWPARSALIQGVFLGALGLGVLATTGYPGLVLNQPEAEWMGLFLQSSGSIARDALGGLRAAAHV